jgi:hypothetical protein
MIVLQIHPSRFSHVFTSNHGVYDLTKLPKERKKIMEVWGKYCYSLIREKAKKA